MCSEGGGKDLFREVHRQSGSISSEAPQEGEHFAEENRQLGGPWRGGGSKKHTRCWGTTGLDYWGTSVPGMMDPNCLHP